jgi:hypothetical protein
VSVLASINRGAISATWLVRLLCAAAIAAASFVTIREEFQGDCLLPFYDMTRAVVLFTLAIGFALAFIWFVSEVTQPVLRSGSLAIAFGVVTYAATGFAGWLASPNLPHYFGDDEPLRATIWVFWSVGLLFRTGNFSNVPCGY